MSCQPVHRSPSPLPIVSWYGEIQDILKQAKFIALAALVCFFAPLPLAAANGCFVAPPPELSWVTSGVSHRDEPGVFWLADDRKDQIVKVHADGHSATVLEREGLSQIRTFNEGFLILVYDQGMPQLINYTRDFEDPQLFDLSKHMGADAVYAIYDYVQMGKGILAFGDVAGSLPAATRLFYVDTQGNKVFYNHYYAYSSNPDKRDNTVLNYVTDDSLRFLASIGDVGYMLVLQDPIWIAKVEFRQKVGAEVREVQLLRHYDREKFRFPQLQLDEEFMRASNSGQVTPAFFDILKRESAVAGLFAGEDQMLYVLSKERPERRKIPRGFSGREIDWKLTKLDPSDGEEVAESKLPVPINTAALNIIPSGNAWYLLPKSSVRILGEEYTPVADYKMLVALGSDYFSSGMSGLQFEDCNQRSLR